MSRLVIPCIVTRSLRRASMPSSTVYVWSKLSAFLRLGLMALLWSHRQLDCFLMILRPQAEVERLPLPLGDLPFGDLPLGDCAGDSVTAKAAALLRGGMVAGGAGRGGAAGRELGAVVASANGRETWHGAAGKPNTASAAPAAGRLRQGSKKGAGARRAIIREGGA